MSTPRPVVRLAALLSLVPLACSESSGSVEPLPPVPDASVADDSGGATGAADTVGSDTVGTPDASGGGGQPARWWLDPETPADLANKVLTTFGGRTTPQGTRLWLCGQGGVFREWTDAGWETLDIAAATVIEGCHVGADGTRAAVGAAGKVWRMKPGEAWADESLLIEQPGLQAVWVGDAEIVVVGVAGTVYRFDVTGWTKETLAGASGTLRSVWSPGGGIFYAGGDSVILRYSEGAWVQELLPPDAPGTADPAKGFDVRAIHGTDDAHIWAVGVKGTKVAFRGDSGTWSWQDSHSGGPLPLSGVFAVAADQVVAAGSKGLFLRRDGTEWAQEEPRSPIVTPSRTEWPADKKVPLGLDYIGVHAAGKDALWLMARTGQLVRFDGAY